jgi:hypothetical protein
MSEEMPAYIFAFNGVKLRKFYFANPTFDIEEIAWASGMQCRFTGHVRKFYSVAEHGILVSNLTRHLGLGNPFEALMHDGQEGYLNDLSSPVKRTLPDYKALEHQIEARLREWCGFSGPLDPQIKIADRLALYIEAHYLMPEGAIDELIHGDEYRKHQAKEIAHAWRLHCYTPERAREQFLWQYNRLRP